MKIGILAGGLGTRLSEETAVKPKPMVEIGGRPILWHILKSYAAYGFNEFVLGLGYRGDVIKDYFVNYLYRTRSLTVELTSGQVSVHGGTTEDWTVHMLDTGIGTQTGGRVKRIAEFIGDETFMLTYGDGVANIDFNKLLAFHRGHGKLATVTAVRPPARFGGLRFEGEMVKEFVEKPQIGEGWINGGFFVLEPGIRDYIDGDETLFELAPLERLAQEGQLVAHRHEKFWQSMDTLRDVRLLESLWTEDSAPWKVWQ
jgi:glucose-1-phosphate cytidylyltransferase